MGVFNSKIFNSEVFAKYTETVPRVKQNALLSAGVLRPRNELKTLLTDQVGGNYITVPMTGLIGGTPVNYDGATDITAAGIGTYSQNMIVVGRAQAWTEKDFTYDITGKDFMAEIAAQTVNYWDDIYQGLMLSILKGIFACTVDGFKTKHTLDISAATDPKISATTINDAIQQAAGANKNIFTMAIMHSAVATNLENLQLLSYYKGTDANGLQRDMGLATINGKTVLIDDDCPYDSSTGKYTTYLLGKGAFDFCDVGAKTPVSTYRDEKTNGGEEYLYNRKRVLYAPRGFSFVQPSTPIVSPTNTELETAARWTVVKDSAGTGYYNSKAIPMAQIISKG